MRQLLNRDLVLWGLAVVQPASVEDVRVFLEAMYPDSGPMPDETDLRSEFENFAGFGWIASVSLKKEWYSLTEKGNSRLSKSLRHLRDKLRLVLLHGAKNDRFWRSEETVQDLPDVSSGLDSSSGTKEVARPSDSAVIPHTRSGSSARNNSRIRWPRLLEQLEFTVGLKPVSSDSTLSYYSYPTLSSINSACVEHQSQSDLSLGGLALAIGISPRLISSFMHKPENHYRKFEIGKRGGGLREIDAPRLFLKTTLAWINDYLLWRLPVHESCHSFQRGKSIITNAGVHLDRNFVGCLDISDFFGCVRTQQVRRLFVENGFGFELAHTVSRLVTLGDRLPQGAPTSPTISNAILYNFDRRIAARCRSVGLSYSRYADDMSISGSDRSEIEKAFAVVREELGRLQLRLNDRKTRIASSYGQQLVTGVVVNEKLQPPRKLRRKIRAMFHRASVEEENSPEILRMLNGYLSYLRSFPVLRDRKDIRNYEEILRTLQG